MCAKKKKQQMIYDHDKWLLPYKDVIDRRHKMIMDYKEKYSVDGSLSKGVNNHVYYGMHRDEKGNWVCLLDFLPDLDEPLMPMLQRKRETNLPAEELLTGILHNRLGRVIVKEAGISAHAPIRQLEDWELEKVCDEVFGLQIPLTEPMGMDSAQVTAGGIFTSEFDPNTMESKLVPGLYACGEVLDIDGDCGGYNLQWAWSSGYLAGISAGKG